MIEKQQIKGSDDDEQLIIELFELSNMCTAYFDIKESGVEKEESLFKYATGDDVSALADVVDPLEAELPQVPSKLAEPDSLDEYVKNKRDASFYQKTLKKLNERLNPQFAIGKRKNDDPA